ncbi:MAG: hypothetical protein WAY93_08150 [Atopobiaceae bacterium]|jgi:hypothetical protein|nr:hypothetical protein [Atopobiaceae bacterium]
MDATDEVLESGLADDELEACLRYQLESCLQERAAAVLDGRCRSLLLDFAPRHLASLYPSLDQTMRALERVVRRLAERLEASGIILSIRARVGEGIVLSVANSAAFA